MILISIILIYSVIKTINFRKVLKLNFKGIINLNSLNLDENSYFCVGKEFNEKEIHNFLFEKEKNREIFFIFTFTNYLANFLIVSLIANVQIINRVATSNPIIFIFCSEYILRFIKQKDKLGKFILIIFISYSIVGCIMHCASYGYA